MLWDEYGGLKTMLWSQLSPSTFIQVSGVELKLPALHGKHLYPLSQPFLVFVFFFIKNLLNRICLLCISDLSWNLLCRPGLYRKTLSRKNKNKPITHYEIVMLLPSKEATPCQLLFPRFEDFSEKFSFNFYSLFLECSRSAGCERCHRSRACSIG